MKTSRRDALRSFALLGGASLFALSFAPALGGCAAPSEGDEDLDGEGGEDVLESDLVTCKPPVISANHGHALVVPPADVTAAKPKTYSIQGSSGHPHDVTLTAAHFAQLATGKAITVTSTNVAGHTHDVTVSCTVTKDPPKPAACSKGAKATTISANHGHSLVVPAADVTKAATKTYSIKGSSGHPHSVTLTAAHFKQLAAGKSVVLASTNDALHTHQVTISCA